MFAVAGCSGDTSKSAHTIPVLCRTADSKIRGYLIATGEQFRSSIVHASEITKEVGITTDMLFDGAASHEENCVVTFEVFHDGGDTLRYVVSWCKSQYTEELIRALAGVYDQVLLEFTERENLRDVNFATTLHCQLWTKPTTQPQITTIRI